MRSWTTVDRLHKMVHRGLYLIPTLFVNGPLEGSERLLSVEQLIRSSAIIFEPSQSRHQSEIVYEIQIREQGDDILAYAQTRFLSLNQYRQLTLDATT